MVWYSRNAAGVWDAYIGNGNCQGTPLLPSYDGNRGPADITANGRYVLLTTAVGVDKTLHFSAPGQGSGNAIELYDRQTGKLSTLLPGGTASQRGVIWPTFNSDASKIVWSQMIKTAAEDPPVGRWALHVADVDLAAGTLSNNVEWQDPNGEANFFEAYGWIPNTDLLVFMSGRARNDQRAARRPALHAPGRTQPQHRADAHQPSSSRLRGPGRNRLDAFHEFAHFAPGDPNTLYTSIGDGHRRRRRPLLVRPAHPASQRTARAADTNQLLRRRPERQHGQPGDTRLAGALLHRRHDDGLGQRRLGA